MKACFGTDIHASFIIGLCISFHKAFDLFKLPAHFYNNALRRPSYRIHSKGREYKGQAGADKDPH